MLIALVWTVVWASGATGGVNQGVIIAIIAAVGGGAAATLIGGLFSQPKNRAETKKLVAEEGRTIDQRWKDWADELEQRIEKERAEHAVEIEEMKSRLTEVEATVRDREHEVEQLNRQVAQLERSLSHERLITRSVIGWAFAMRDEIRNLGGVIPDAPRPVDDYINDLDESLRVTRLGDTNPDTP